MSSKISWFAVRAAAAVGSASCLSTATLLDGNYTQEVVKQPSFGASTNLRLNQKKLKAPVTVDSMVLLAGSSHPSLAKEVSDIIKVPIAKSDLNRFADGECSIRIDDHIRGKDVYIIQTCAAPVNDSIMELLLTISCARRAGARRIIAVIPYFGYKHHRRSSPISTKHSSRFQTSNAMDISKMIQEMGVSRVISVDLQRPGQGHEACFFDISIPLETLITNELFIDYFAHKAGLQEPVVVLAPNAEIVKKAKKIQVGLQPYFKQPIKLAALFSSDYGSGYRTYVASDFSTASKEKLLGADVVVVDDIVNSARTLNMISDIMSEAGARNIYLCASHGLFSQNSMKIIDSIPKLRKVVVTNTLPLPKYPSKKIEQLSVGPAIAKLLLAEHLRKNDSRAEETFVQSDESLEEHA